MQEPAIILGLIIFIPCLLFVIHQAPIDLARSKHEAHSRDPVDQRNGHSV
jgi:hypothetical protein